MSKTTYALSERFEVAFNKIHFKLKAIVNSKNDNFLHVLNLAKERHSYVRPYYDVLRQYAKLRNSIVHYKLEPLKYIAEPHIDVVEDIELIQQKLLSPPLAYSIASKNVVSFDPTTSLRVILDKVDETGFSQFPIYDETGFKGLLTEGGIAKWLARNGEEGFAILESVTAVDILTFEKKHNVDFLSRNKGIYELENLFEEYFEKNQKLEAVIISQNGRMNEKPLGIVTSWDLVQIDHVALSLVAN